MPLSPELVYLLPLGLHLLSKCIGPHPHGDHCLQYPGRITLWIGESVVCRVEVIPAICTLYRGLVRNLGLRATINLLYFRLARNLSMLRCFSISSMRRCASARSRYAWLRGSSSDCCDCCCSSSGNSTERRNCARVILCCSASSSKPSPIVRVASARLSSADVKGTVKRHCASRLVMLPPLLQQPTLRGKCGCRNPCNPAPLRRPTHGREFPVWCGPRLLSHGLTATPVAGYKLLYHSYSSISLSSSSCSSGSSLRPPWRSKNRLSASCMSWR